MALRVYEPTPQQLGLRVVSALVLMPVVFGATWLGGYWFTFLVIVSAGAMSWEWSRLGNIESGFWGLATAAVLAIFAATGGEWEGSIIAAGIGGLATGAIAVHRGSKHVVFLASGAILVVLAPAALAWLRSDPNAGRDLALWVLGVVWATDTGAYIVGRAVGGRRLAPKLSLGKTWAGLAGGMSSAALIAAGWAIWIGPPRLWFGVVLAAVGALVAQGGDLCVSAAKRRFGVKDSGHMIPGHGGILDRTAGLITLAPIMAGMTLIALADGARWD